MAFWTARTTQEHESTRTGMYVCVSNTPHHTEMCTRVRCACASFTLFVRAYVCMCVFACVCACVRVYWWCGVRCVYGASSRPSCTRWCTCTQCVCVHVCGDTHTRSWGSVGPVYTSLSSQYDTFMYNNPVRAVCACALCVRACCVRVNVVRAFVLCVCACACLLLLCLCVL